MVRREDEERIGHCLDDGIRHITRNPRRFRGRDQIDIGRSQLLIDDDQLLVG